MSISLERSALALPLSERRRAAPPADRWRGRPALLVACEELWKRTAGGNLDRLPDPNRHPECWFKFI